MGDGCSSAKTSTTQRQTAGGTEEEAMALRSKVVEKEQEVVPRVKAHSVDFQKG